MNWKKRIKSLVLVAFVAFGLVTPSITSQAVVHTYNKSDSHPHELDIYLNKAGLVTYDEITKSFIFVSDNVLRQPNNTYYHTIGFEFSRIKTGIDAEATSRRDRFAGASSSADPHYYVGNDREYIYVDFDQKNREEIQVYNVDMGNQHQSCIYVIPESVLLDTIANHDPEWHAEIKETQAKGEIAYIGIDAVDIIYPTPKFKASGGAKSTNANGNVTYLGTVYRWNNYTKMYNTFGSQATQTGIATAYGMILPLGQKDTTHHENQTGETPPPETTTLIKFPTDPANGPDNPQPIPTDGSTPKPNTDDTKSGVRGSAPVAYTYHTSDDFNLGEGIPTTESFTNGVELSSWYGKAGITKKYQQYVVPVNWYITTHWTTYISVPTYDEKGYYTGTKQVPKDNYHTHHGTYNYVFSNYYYYISTLDFYQLTGATVENGAYGSATYNEDPHIQYNVTAYSEYGGNATSENGVILDSISNRTITASVENDPHCTIPTIESNERILNDTIEGGTADPSNEAVEAYVAEQLAKRFGNRSLQTKNDHLELNNITYLTESSINFEFASGKAKDMGYANNDITYDSQTVTIPEKTANGAYETTLTAKYRHMITSGGSMKNITISPNPTTYTAIDRNYLANEPIVVHSPVVSPIYFTNAEAQTQAKQVEGVGAQLILDNTYHVKFDWANYFKLKGYGGKTDDTSDVGWMAAGWTKYVQDKKVRFPFDVKVNGHYYEVSKSTGYTQWISLGNVTEFDFYVPSWAQEGVFGFTKAELNAKGVTNYCAYSNSDKKMQVRVEANNYDESLAQVGEEYTYNKELDRYVATYDYTLQTSGVLYGMDVTATDNVLSFGGLEEFQKGTKVYQFFLNEEDRFVGDKNRLGGDNQRYYWTGNLDASHTLRDTLPFATGKSKAGSLMGYLYKGDTIGYVLRTIANLDGTNDSIKITPSFTYIAKNGAVYDNSEFNMYYYTQGNVLVKVGSQEDLKNRKETWLGSEYFENDLYSFRTYDKSKNTAKKFKETVQKLNFTKTKSYAVGDVELKSTQKLLAGDEEELAANINNAGAGVLRYNGTGATNLDNLNRAMYDEFKTSMQTWYGNYYIPNDLMVVKKDADGKDAIEKAFEKDGYIVTADVKKLTEDGGILVVNFDITTYMNGYEHLHYYSGLGAQGLNMWEREQGNNDVPTVPIHGTTKTNDVPVKPGDIAVVDLGLDANDAYQVGDLYIN